MPAAVSARVAEGLVRARSEILPRQLVETDEPPEPLENGDPARCAEFVTAASAFIFMGLVMLPEKVKKGQFWYTGAHSLILLTVIGLVACLFWGNTHIQMIRFLSRKNITRKVVALTLIDWLRVMIMPDPGWEVTSRISFTSVTLTRLAFISLDSLKGMSRWFRLFMAFFFILGNMFSVVKAYFVTPEATIFTISATNTTITTCTVQAGVGTTIVTLTTAMLVTIWQDKDFQYSALYRSYLPKLAVETAEIEPGSAEMQQLLEQRDAAVIAWRGWPRKSAVVILVSVIVFLLSTVLSDTERHFDGSESTAMLVMRGTALTLGCGGHGVFVFNNVDWRRLQYTVRSTQGLLWMFYTLIYALTGLSRPSPLAPISSMLGTVYTTLGFIGWLSFEAVQQTSRLLHITITFSLALTLAVTIYLSAFVWQDDVVLADLNGVGVAGILTKYAMQRTCFINLLLLMAGSLVTVVTKNLSDNRYFALVEGDVLRLEILEIQSLSADDADGDNSFSVQDSLEHRINRRRALSHAQRRKGRRMTNHRDADGRPLNGIVGHHDTVLFDMALKFDMELNQLVDV